MKKSRKTPTKIGKVPKSLISDAERKRNAEITEAILNPKRSKSKMSDATKSIILKSNPFLGTEGALLQYAVTKSIERDQKIDEAEKLQAAEAEGIVRHVAAYRRYVERNRSHRKFKTRWSKDIRLYEEFIILRPYRLEGQKFGLADRRLIRKWFWELSPKMRAEHCASARQYFNEIRRNMIAKRYRPKAGQNIVKLAG